MPRPRDSQKQKCYTWEYEFIKQFELDENGHRGKQLEMDECRWLIEKACRRWKVKPPERIKDGRGTRIARGGIHYINLPMWARTELIVLHEVAHTITDRKWGHYNIAGHGAEYMSVFTDLLAWHFDVPIGKVRKSARDSKLKIYRKGGSK
jgi:hypothetical protein